ncbi:protein takeout isoform X1 [Drosophila virilis]|uniref:protein takeout isoform X1 n=2 Tax=Drosophila virilis TaxID=7244 RepID=UPI0013961A26|nr:protein takeout [Drosophila virilis]
MKCFAEIYLKITLLCLYRYVASDIEKCHFGDGKCIAKSTNQFIRRYAKGDAKIGLPSFDNIEVDDITLINSPGPLWISYTLKNQVLKGFENATIISLSGLDREPELNKFEVKLKIPSLVMHGNYELRGRGIIVYTNSSGSTKSDMQNVRITITIKGFIEYRNKKRYLKVYEMAPIFELDRWILSADNLFKENTDLTVLLNRVINERWVEFWNEIESTILPVYTRSFVNLINKFVQAIPYDDMFLPD